MVYVYYLVPVVIFFIMGNVQNNDKFSKQIRKQPPLTPDFDKNYLFFSISELNIHGVEEKIRSDQRKRFLVHFFQKIVYIIDFSEKNKVRVKKIPARLRFDICCCYNFFLVTKTYRKQKKIIRAPKIAIWGLTIFFNGASLIFFRIYNNDIFDQISSLFNIPFNLISATFLGAEVVLMSGKMCHEMTISFTDPLPTPLIFGLEEKSQQSTVIAKNNWKYHNLHYRTKKARFVKIYWVYLSNIYVNQ